LSIAFQYKGLLVASVAGATLSRHCQFFMLVHLATTVGQKLANRITCASSIRRLGPPLSETGMPVSKSNHVA
jgi:hypothetical protein